MRLAEARDLGPDRQGPLVQLPRPAVVAAVLEDVVEDMSTASNDVNRIVTVGVTDTDAGPERCLDRRGHQFRPG